VNWVKFIVKHIMYLLVIFIANNRVQKYTKLVL
jgi:hypothetical protein